MREYAICLCCFFLLHITAQAKNTHAHGGGVDAYGCHSDRQQGGIIATGENSRGGRSSPKLRCCKPKRWDKDKPNLKSVRGGGQGRRTRI